MLFKTKWKAKPNSTETSPEINLHIIPWTPTVTSNPTLKLCINPVHDLASLPFFQNPFNHRRYLVPTEVKASSLRIGPHLSLWHSLFHPLEKKNCPLLQSSIRAHLLSFLTPLRSFLCPLLHPTCLSILSSLFPTSLISLGGILSSQKHNPKPSNKWLFTYVFLSWSQFSLWVLRTGCWKF